MNNLEAVYLLSKDKYGSIFESAIQGLLVEIERTWA